MHTTSREWPKTPQKEDSVLEIKIPLYKPSILHEFIGGQSPNFILEMNKPMTTHAFRADVPDVNYPCFLLYVCCRGERNTQPITFTLNGVIIRGVYSDNATLDVTDCLTDRQNLLQIEVDDLTHHFYVVGLWMQKVSIEGILEEIQSREGFEFNEYASVCPISGKSIEIPVRGVNCTHTECFDFIPYIAYCCALSMWICPICGQEIPLKDLRLGKIS